MSIEQWIYKASTAKQTSFIMSDVPEWFEPLMTSSPKKRESRVDDIVSEVKLLDLESETVAEMEGIKDPLPVKGEKEHFYATL